MRTYTPIEGYALNPLLKIPRNPLLKIPRNHVCPCKSGKKFKQCHLKTMPRYIPIDLVEEYSKGMKAFPLVEFVGDENQIPHA